MLDGIKSKLGFADAGQGYDDGYYDRGYDDRSFQDEFGDERDAEEFGEYGPGYREDDVAADEGAGSGYDRYAPVTTRPVRTGRSAARSAAALPPSSSPSTTCAPARRFPRASPAIRSRRAA